MLVFNIDATVVRPELKNLIRFAETQAATPYILKEYIVTSLVEDENILSEVCERNGTAGQSLRLAAMEDINELWEALSSDIFNDYEATARHCVYFDEFERSICLLVLSSTTDELLDRLISHYVAFGGGKNSRYIAFKWRNGLVGTGNPDDIRLNSLYCLDGQKKTVCENTVAFLRGMPSDNVLLYGTKGSGKSSMVKALLNEYYGNGLRLVEIAKENLSELPKLIDCIKDKRFKYIVFMDDLSFEKNEYEYKNLKVILEGQIEKQPKNILFYATSNRRNIVHESWDDRRGDDIHISDTMNEKLSLAERFGIKVYFSVCDKNDYFGIIKGILEENNVALTDQIKADAIKWELQHGGRSGRAAARFAKTL